MMLSCTRGEQSESYRLPVFLSPVIDAIPSAAKKAGLLESKILNRGLHLQKSLEGTNEPRRSLGELHQLEQKNYADRD